METKMRAWDESARGRGKSQERVEREERAWECAGWGRERGG